MLHETTSALSPGSICIFCVYEHDLTSQGPRAGRRQYSLLALTYVRASEH